MSFQLIVYYKRNLVVMNNLYHKVAVASVCTALGFVLGANEEAKAATFTLPPTIRFEAIDYTWDGNSFDGLGDVVFIVGANIVNGTEGETADLQEFNIGSFSLAPNTVISSVLFKAKIATFLVGGLGVGPLNPGSLGIFGYVGNGTAEPSDFEAGVLLSSVDISASSPGDILNFDVTPFINQRVSNGDAFAGFAIRALNLGTVALGGPNALDRGSLVIETVAVTEPVPEPTTIFGSVIGLGLGGWLKRKKSSQQNKTTSQN
jgi:hypothetical protein